MKQNIYNAKFKTKQIFDLNCQINENPGSNQAFYWLTYQNNQLFSNYKVGENDIITKPVNEEEYVPTNKDVLDKINVDENGNLTFDDQTIQGQAEISENAGNAIHLVQNKLFVEKDYTAFEVYAHDFAISAGTLISDTELANKIYDQEVLSSTIDYTIPASMIHQIKVRTMVVNPNDSDVIIDWGDGTVESVKNQNYISSQIDEGINEGNYIFQHTYVENGFYIVKIYGEKYYNLQFPNNLICRVFDHDLPIANHYKNLSQFCKGANNLLFASFENIKYNTYEQCQGIFNACKNLIKVIGCSPLLSAAINSSFFTSCTALKYTDYKLPLFGVRPNSNLALIFNNCPKLELDINDLIPDTYGVCGEVSVTNLFQYCSSLTGTVPGEKLWFNKNIEWINTTNVFNGCSDQIRAQAPVSWGGNNESIDNQMLIENKDYYTAFEVYAHDFVISAGTLISDTELAANISDTDVLADTIAYEIPAEMTHQMKIRALMIESSESDLIIDWGDGTIESVKNNNFIAKNVNSTTKENIYTFQHTYVENGIYKVKIYGKTYINIQHPKNILCRVFDNDLPVAPHFKDISQFCNTALNLTYVSFKDVVLNRFENCCNLFNVCRNLLKVVNCVPALMNAQTISLFNSCNGLKYTDMILPLYVNNSSYAINNMFHNCPKLTTDIAQIFPNITINGQVNINNLFKWDAKLTGTVPAEKLWNNKNVEWLNTENVFTGCSAQIRAQVPTSWGGTASDDIIEKKKDINYLLFRIPIIESDYSYNLKVQLSKTDSFTDILTYTTINDYSLFKVFNGWNMQSLTSQGISFVFSDEQLQFDISEIDRQYKYFRFHWTDDNGNNYGRYGYGNIESSIQIFDISSSNSDTISIVNKVISFTSEDGDNVSWSDGIATFTHNMNCMPLVFLYDENMEQVLYGIKVIDGNSFSIDFKDSSIITGTWKIVISYGVAFQ